VDERSHKVAQTLQQQWFKSLGITVKLQRLEAQLFMQRVRERTFQIALLENLLRRRSQLGAVVGALKVDWTAVGFFKENFTPGSVARKPCMVNDNERADPVHQQPWHEEQTKVEVRSPIDFVEGDHEMLLA
jgi:hypothetical protein